MTELETLAEAEVEEFSDELSDEALDLLRGDGRPQFRGSCFCYAPAD
jgi:hypothetical protein